MFRRLFNLPSIWSWVPSTLALAMLWLSVWKLTALNRSRDQPLNPYGLNVGTGTGQQGQKGITAADSDTPGNPPQPTVAPDVIVDAGHGGKDGGTQGHRILEKNGTLEIAKAVAAELRSRGLKVTMTREKDVTVDNMDRAKLSHTQPRLAFISIHLNHGVAGRGIETYYADVRKPAIQLISLAQAGLSTPVTTLPVDRRSELLAKCVHQGAVATTGAVNRGIRKGNGFMVLNSTACPALLIECGFVSDSKEASNLKSPDYQKKLATGIADGLQEYLAKVKSEAGYGLK